MVSGEERPVEVVVDGGVGLGGAHRLEHDVLSEAGRQRGEEPGLDLRVDAIA